jgi:hypothetical protein
VSGQPKSLIFSLSESPLREKALSDCLVFNRQCIFFVRDAPMAKIRIRNTNERISGEENVRAFLEQQEVLYEHWSPAKLPAELDNKFVKIRRSRKHKHNQIFYYTNKTLSQAHTHIGVSRL